MIQLSQTIQYGIDNTILNLLLRTNLSYPKDSLLKIVDGLGIEVNIVDFEELGYGKNVEGVIDFSKKSRILLSKTVSKTRRLFILAHELGHFVLKHKPNAGKRFRIDGFDYTDKNNEEQVLEEMEANYFAASLLVPKNELTMIFTELGGSVEHIPEIANYFGVSESMIWTRLKWIQKN